MLLGIDIGTTGVRSALFAPDGRLIADASAACTNASPRPGWAEAPPDMWWQAVQSTIPKLGVSLSDVRAIGVVGQAPTAVLVDASLAPIAPAILWLDTRAAQEARELGTHAYYLGPKLLWLSRHAEKSLESARFVLQSHSFIAAMLTGEVAVDPSTAALCLPLFDLETRTWRDDAMRGVVHRAQLPPVTRAHEVIGSVTATAAAVVGGGLRTGTPVVAGGGDFAAAALGAGVIAEGEACLMLGTAGNLLVPRSKPGTDPRVINAHHVGSDLWLSLGGTLSGGAQEWLRHALVRAIGTEDTAVRTALPAFDVLDEEAERVSVGSEGLLFLPYLQGERTPIWDVDARGAYVGLGLNHGRGHLWRALLEGIALSFVDCQEIFERDGVSLRSVVAANGGGKSALFRRILCDALGVPLSYAPGAGGTVAGAAILAGLGVGALTSADIRAFRGTSLAHEPTASEHRRYRELLLLRRQAYAGLSPVFHGLAALR